MVLDASQLLEVARRPDDDGWRSVVADRIAEHDPELGTFIQLQLAASHRALDPRQSAEMNRILREHHREWVQPIASALRPGHYGFWRGFLDVANAFPRNRADARELGRSAVWATVRQVAAPRYLPLLLKGGMFRSVRTLGTAFLPGPNDTRVAPAWGLALKSGTLGGIRLPPTVTGLQVALPNESSVRAFLNCFGRGSLAGIREVGITSTGRISRRVLEEFPDTLQRLSLSVPRHEVETWIALGTRLFTDLATIDAVVDGEVLTLRRSEDWDGLYPPQPTC